MVNGTTCQSSHVHRPTGAAFALCIWTTSVFVSNRHDEQRKTVIPAEGIPAVGSESTPITNLVLLPCDPTYLMAELGGECTECGYELVDLVDSAMVPWTLLLQCG